MYVSCPQKYAKAKTQVIRGKEDSFMSQIWSENNSTQKIPQKR